MPVMYKITLLPKGEVRTFTGTRGNYYLLSDDLKIEVRKWPVWCRECQAFSEGEHIQSVPELEQAVADYSDINSAENQRVLQLSFIRDKAEFIAKRLAERTARLQWRRGRTAPPKCLECGTMDIVDLGDGQEVASPCSPGTLTIGGVAMCSTAFRNYFYTPEGDRIPIKTQPSRWYMTR